MKGPEAGKPGRGTEAPTRTTSTRHAASAILIVLALGLAFRLILAHVLPGSGFRVDLIAFRFWADNLAQDGPFGFYARDFFHDYTPGYMYFLWLVGGLEDALRVVADLLRPVPLLGILADLPPLSMLATGDFIKLPAILADLALGWLAWSMAREIGAGRRAGLVAAAIVVFNPITWFDSVVWGQVDSVGMVFLLLGIRELWRDRPERSAVFTVIAAIIKPQLGILVPIVAAVTIRRALWPVDPDDADESEVDAGATTTDWERRVQGPVRILTTGLAGVVTAILLSAPFGLSIVDLGAQVATAAGGYPYLTVNAYNPWALLEHNGGGLAATGTWVCDVIVATTAGGGACTEAFTFGSIPAVVVGTTLLLVAILAIALVVARRPDRVTILVGVAILTLAFFVLPTRVHERYLYPLYAVAVILAAVSWRWRIAYVAAAVATFANMYVVLTTIYTDNPGITDWLGIGQGLRSAPGVTIVAALTAGAFAWAALQLRAEAMERLTAEIDQAAAAEPPADETWEVEAWAPSGDRGATGAPVEWLPEDRSRRRWRPALEPRAAGTSTAASTATSTAASTAAAGLPVWHGRPSFVEAGPVGWFMSRIGDRPVRADRSAVLAGERGGRLDRLDLWILAVLVVAALVLRVWRLAEPYRMHFDEVYHARTGTEFLQSWRYGLDHDIYEWTHPHLAKYAMAGGLAAFGDDRVGATSELGVQVRAAVVEERWLDSLDPDRRAGDRLHVATGSEIRSYDLHTRALVSTEPLAGSSALAVDPALHVLYAGTDTGELLAIDLHQLDADRAAGGPHLEAASSVVARLDAGIARIHVTADGAGLVVVLTSGDLVMLDPGDGTELGRASFEAITSLADAGTTTAVVARPPSVVDPAAAAATLAAVLGGDAGEYEAQLTAEADRVVIAAIPETGDRRTEIDDALANGELEGISVDDVTRVAVGYDRGIAFLAPSAGAVVQRMQLDGGVQGMAFANFDQPSLYVTNDHPDGPRYAIVTVGGTSAPDDANLGQTFPLPAPGGWVGFDESSDQIHILGPPPAGRPSDQAATVYVIEPHANAVYADAALPFAPAAIALDVNESFLSSDRQELLALEADGTVATVDVGSHAFAWRLPGVLAGVAMAALLYVLARILFERRAVAVVVALLVLLDGMLFVQSRIAMNDAYVGLFIVAAYTLFAALWTGWWRWRGAFWVAMPVVGVLLGLALASKWVAAYAIGALGILILARSALGRVVLLAGLIVVTTVLGYLAISVPADTPPAAGWQIGGLVIQGNLAFMLIMIALTLLAAVVMVLHPIAWSFDELRFAIGAPAIGGLGVALLALATGRMNRLYHVGPIETTPLQLAFGLAFLSIAVAAAFWLAGRAGFGPLAPPPRHDDPVRLLESPAPAPEGWLRPGWALGIPVGWMVACLIAIPIAVYVLSYVPWARLDSHQLVPGWPAGHGGQTLVDLTKSMYDYHNELTDAHPASSPWWAWPLDLKPVWFYQESFAGGTSAAIYDAGNLAIWWMAIPGMAFAAWQAYKRRSLALALVAIGFACQWIPWARIDRAAFQYHYYTELPFLFMGLAYFIAELWHGASRRTWLMARLAAGAAVIGPAVMWLLHRPICNYVRVDAVNPGSQACPTLIPEMVLTWRTAALAVVVGVAVFFLVRQFVALDRYDASDGRGTRGALLPIAVGAGLGLLGLFVVARFIPEVPALRVEGVPVEPIAILVGVPLLGLAAIVATARDARRFVIGLIGAFAAVFLVWYPNISGLPLPDAVFNAYQGVLPTYLYPFQFPVSLVNRNIAPPSLFALGPLALLLALTAAAAILGYCAWLWRIALAERRLDATEDGTGSAYAGTRP